MYQGEDLIIVTGAPGSRWSGVIRLLSLICKEINISDNTARRVYEKRDAEGKVIGWHRGAYWGPHNRYGHKFDKLNTLSKEEVLEEFKKQLSPEQMLALEGRRIFDEYLKMINKKYKTKDLSDEYLSECIEKIINNGLPIRTINE